MTGSHRDHRAPIDARFVAIPRPDVHTVRIDGEAVLLDETSGRLHRLNPTAALVWACLDGASPISDIVADISDVLGVPRERVLTDTLTITRQLNEEGLLADANPGTGDDRGRQSA